MKKPLPKPNTKKRVHFQTKPSVQGETDSAQVPAVASPTKKARLHPDHTPRIVAAEGKISKCYGCNGMLKPKNGVPPPLVFKLPVNRKRPPTSGKNGNRWIESFFKKPAYFHVKNLECLRIILPDVEKRHVHMNDEEFDKLRPEQIHFLQLKGYWDHINKNRANIP